MFNLAFALMLAGAARAQVPALEPVALDLPVPGARGGSLTVHVEAGRRARDFHVTFERDGKGRYIYFDGANWSSPLSVTNARPFRSGVHIAVDRSNTAHLAWVEGAGDREGTVFYRTVRDGKRGAIEKVHAPQGWNECDITVSPAGNPVIAANTTIQEELATYERSAAGWKQTVLPSDNREHKWAPSIVWAENDLLFVASRRKNAHPFTWRVRENGQWTKDAALPVRSYEPNAIAHGAGMIAASLDGFVYFVAQGGDDFVTSHRDVRATKRGIIRGQHVGIGLTRGGTLVLSHSDMANEPSTDRTIGRQHRYYYSYSRDLGQTWTLNQPVAPEPGQGHGNLAANGDWVMLVWPDIREPAGLRYALLRDPGE